MLKILKDKIIELYDKKDNIKKHKKEINILFRRVFPRKWVCSICSFDNEEIISICSKCGYDNPFEKELIDKEAYKTKDEIGIDTKTKWTCEKCTSINEFPNTKCLACESSISPFRPKEAPPGWKGSISEENLRKKLNDYTIASIIKPIKVDSKSDLIPGIENCGNSCYMAASLQALLSVPEVLRFFTSKNFLFDNIRQTHSQGYAGDLALVFSGIAHAHKINKYTLRIGPKSSINTLKNILARDTLLGTEFAGDKQHGVNSFIPYFLNGLFEDTKYTNESDGRDWKDLTSQPKDTLTRSPMRDIFGNTLVSRYSCSANCDYIKDMSQFSSLIEVPIPSDVKTLEDCISYYTIKSIITSKCPTCNRERYFQKLLDKPSNVLILHIQRRTYIETKIETPIKIPLVIDSLKKFKILANDKEPDVAYELNAVILHSGTAFSGHYIAIVRAPDKINWLKCDDNRVSVFPNFEQSMLTGIIGDMTVTTTVYVKIGIEWTCPTCSLVNTPTSTECSSGCGTKAPKI